MYKFNIVINFFKFFPIYIGIRDMGKEASEKEVGKHDDLVNEPKISGAGLAGK